MKPHKYKDLFHCESCWEKAEKHFKNLEMNKKPCLFVSPSQYPFVKKYGLSLGIEKWMNRNREL